MQGVAAVALSLFVIGSIKLKFLFFNYMPEEAEIISPIIIIIQVSGIQYSIIEMLYTP